MPCRLAKPAACPLLGEATATTSLSSGIAFTAPATAMPEESEVVAVASPRDRKSTRLNSSHTVNSYAVFFLTKKTNLNETVEYRETRRARRRLDACEVGVVEDAVE